jgi:hypothetical protein
VRELGAAIVAAEDAPHTRTVLLDRLYALQRPSLHDSWQEHWCALCAAPEHALAATTLVWLESGERLVCVVCVRATSMLAMLPYADEAWPACPTHFEGEIREAIVRQRGLR